MPNPRVAKVAERIKEIVASQIDTKLKDPRLGMVTVTDVRVTGDLQHATIFYTVFGSEEDRLQSARALESAKGVIRSAVGKQLGLRLTPSIEFIADALPESAKSIEDVLVAARFRDEQIRREAAGATYAGDADPYKKPRVIDDADESAESDADSGEDRSDVEGGAGDPDAEGGTDEPVTDR